MDAIIIAARNRHPMAQALSNNPIHAVEGPDDHAVMLRRHPPAETISGNSTRHRRLMIPAG